jgi:hypothetical protein
MKVRIPAVLLLIALVAWMPAVAQQSAAPQQSTPNVPAAQVPQDAAKSCCGSCEMGKPGEKASADHHSAECCDAKDAKSMSCCQSKDGKEAACCSKDSKSMQECCKAKDAKLCAAKSGKDCCGKSHTKDGKSCWGKDAMACNTKDGQRCCAGMSDHCVAHASGR